MEPEINLLPYLATPAPFRGDSGMLNPWELVSKQSGDRLRTLNVAGAPIAAEIDRLQRTSPYTPAGTE